MDFDLMISSFPKLLSAALITLKLLSASLFFGLLVGLFFAILRINKNIFVAGSYFGSGIGAGTLFGEQIAIKANGENSNEIDIIEINEAFASQSIACIKDLKIDINKVNLDGGALALGHPLGATGSRITGKASELLIREKKKYALSTQCIGLGMGIATVIENIQ